MGNIQKLYTLPTVNGHLPMVGKILFKTRKIF